MRSYRTTSWRKSFFALAAVALSIVLSEAALRVVSTVSAQARFYLSPPWGRDVRLPDPELGHRMTPLYPGNDAWGFRNPRVPDRSDVLAIGDSMTYGFGARADKCWPRQLEPLIGTSVYSMASGGYGPVEYHVLLNRGLALNPETVILTLYTANDFSGAYRSVHLERRGREFGSQDQAVWRELAAANNTTPFADPFAGANRTTSDSGVNPVRRFLSDHSAIYGLVRGIAAAISDQRGISMGESADEHSFDQLARQPGRYIYDADPRFKTAFLDAKAFGMSMDLDDVRILEGLRITENILRSSQSTLRARSVRFLVVLIPTKETVYAPIMRAQPHTPDAYFELLQKEQRLIDEVEAFLEREGIAWVNTTSALRASLERDVRPFPPNDNTHPNAHGYGAIAAAIASALTQLPSSPR